MGCGQRKWLKSLDRYVSDSCNRQVAKTRQNTLAKKRRGRVPKKRDGFVKKVSVEHGGTMDGVSKFIFRNSDNF